MLTFWSGSATFSESRPCETSSRASYLSLEQSVGRNGAVAVDTAVVLNQLRYNIAPSQQVPVIVRNEERNILKPMRWGLVPSWTDHKAIWQRLINARAETLRERPSYKRLVSTQRCLIPADGFYRGNAKGTRKCRCGSTDVNFFLATLISDFAKFGIPTNTVASAGRTPNAPPL